MRISIALLMLAASCGLAAAEPLDTLISAERAFAASSPRLGVKAAFLGVLAEDAWLFRPGPVNGREWYAARPEVAPFILEWAPQAGEAVADFGYTYGPYRLTPRDARGVAGAPVGGHFFSVWTRDADGTWRLWLDQGVAHAPIAFPTRVDPHASAHADEGGEMKALETLDDALNALLAGPHDAAAVARFHSADAVLLRAGQRPQSPTAATTWTPMRAKATRTALRISADGRLAATTGWAEGASPQTYQRAWRFESGGWRVVVDLVGD